MVPVFVLLTKTVIAGNTIKVPKKQMNIDKIQIQICFIILNLLFFDDIPEDTRGNNSESPESGSFSCSLSSFLLLSSIQIVKPT